MSYITRYGMEAIDEKRLAASARNLLKVKGEHKEE